MENKKETLKEHIASYMEDRRKRREAQFYEDHIKEVQSDEEELFEIIEDPEEVKDTLVKDLNKLEEEEASIEEIEQRIKEVAENLENVAETLQIPVLVCGVKHSLMDKLNCNITPIPLLNVALISNIKMQIVDIEMKPEMESMLELVLSVLVLVNDKGCYYKFTLGNLYNVGLVTVVDSLTKEIELTPIEFRGITKEMDLDELPLLSE